MSNSMYAAFDLSDLAVLAKSALVEAHGLAHSASGMLSESSTLGEVVKVANLHKGNASTTTTVIKALSEPAAKAGKAGPAVAFTRSPKGSANVPAKV